MQNCRIFFFTLSWSLGIRHLTAKKRIHKFCMFDTLLLSSFKCVRNLSWTRNLFSWIIALYLYLWMPKSVKSINSWFLILQFVKKVSVSLIEKILPKISIFPRWVESRIFSILIKDGKSLQPSDFRWFSTFYPCADWRFTFLLQNNSQHFLPVSCFFIEIPVKFHVLKFLIISSQSRWICLATLSYVPKKLRTLFTWLPCFSPHRQFTSSRQSVELVAHMRRNLKQKLPNISSTTLLLFPPTLLVLS